MAGAEPAPPPSQPQPPATVIEPVPVAPAPPPAAEPVEIVAQAEAPEPRPDASERVHTVRSGESLWSIAEDLVGPGASTEEIARAVERLWKLNAERIGSGDPDLIVAGERLIVPVGL